MLKKNRIVDTLLVLVFIANKKKLHGHPVLWYITERNGTPESLTVSSVRPGSLTEALRADRLIEPTHPQEDLLWTEEVFLQSLPVLC